ncbi:MAG: hypothetical protein K0Q66_1846 [Chitinophagaceae bacterium]|jgi:hypothetical protein|nr:hypothetical protein [Chitinophagaceae bacterium]
MAILQPGFYFTGSLSNVSAYKMKGSDKIIVRKKGGADKNKIYNSPDLNRVRENFTEFSGRSKACSLMSQAMGRVSRLADHNLVNTLQPLFRASQRKDTVSLRGQLHIRITSAPQLFVGYNLNKGRRFDEIVRSPVKCTLSRETRSAQVVLPALEPGFSFIPGTKLPFYRMVVSLGLMPDVYYHQDGYYPDTAYANELPVHFEGEWYHISKGCPETLVQLQLGPAPAEDHCLVLAVGICFATAGVEGVEDKLKNPGAGKVVAVE